MRKRVSLLALLICLFGVILSPSSVQAQDELTILDNSFQAEFPYQLNFSLSAESDVEVIDIRLHYVVDQLSHVQVTSEVYIEFVPAATVDASWTWDMRRTGGLPPSSRLVYWWTVMDAEGDETEKLEGLGVMTVRSRLLLHGL